MAIPKIIHWCWFGRNPIPDSVKKCIESWKKYCLDFEIIRWDEDNFSFEDCTYAREAYEIGKWAFVSDYARLKIIYEHGGVYLDTDVEILKPIDPLLEYEAFFGFENGHTVAPGLGFGACRHNPIVKEILDQYETLPLYVNDEINPVIIPKVTTKVLLSHGMQLYPKKIQFVENAAILPQEYLCPKDFEMEKTKITKKSFSIHHYDSTWFSPERMEEHKRAVKQRRIEKRFGKLGYKIYLTLAFLFKEGGLRAILRRKLHRN